MTRTEVRRRLPTPFADGYNPGQPRDPRGRWTSTGGIGLALNAIGTNQAVHVPISVVSHTALIKDLTGTEVEGFQHSISNQAMSHTLKNHGNAAVEGKRGQLAVEPGDFDKVPTIVQSGDIRAAEPHRSPNPRIVINATIYGVGYHYVAEVRAGKRRLDMVTMRKKLGSW